MTFAAISLIVISAVVHAVWNLIGKRECPTPYFFLIASITGCVCLSPVLLTHMDVASRFSAIAWKLIVVTGIFQAIYYLGLSGAYCNGHLSVAYPLARSIPVIMVPLVNIAMGRSSQLNWLSIAGMALIVIGGLVLPVERISEWSLRSYLSAACLFALMAAIGTTGYSIVDDAALRALLRTDGLHSCRTTVTLIYAFFEGVSSSFWLLMAMLLSRLCRTKPAEKAKCGAKSAILAGVGICAAYTLVLLAMTFSRNISYIVAFRQLSIPIGAAFGVVVLREPRYPGKLVGTAIMLVGLVIVALK